MVPAPFVVDANVLFPLTLRDTVLRAAVAGFYQLRWSAADKAARLRATMEKYFPDAESPTTHHSPPDFRMMRRTVTLSRLR